MLGVAGSQGSIRLRRQFLGDFRRQRRTGFGGSGTEPQRSDDAPFRQRRPQVLVPLTLTALDAFVEAFPDLVGQFPSLCVAGKVLGGHQHGTEIAEINSFDTGHGGVGAIAPFGDLHGTDERFREPQDTFGRYLGRALGRRLAILLVDSRTHGSEAAACDLFGYDLLLGGQRRDECISVLTAWAELARPGPCRAIGRVRLCLGGGILWLSLGTAVTSAAAVAFAPLAPLRLVFPRVCGSFAAAAFAFALAPGTSRVSLAAAAAPSLAVATAFAAATPALGAGGGRPRTTVGRADELNALGRGFAAAGLGREHTSDEDAVDLELSVHSQNIAFACVRRDKLAVEHAFRLLRAGRAPCPRAVVAPARQLDFEATAHGAFTNTRGRLVGCLPLGGATVAWSDRHGIEAEPVIASGRNGERRTLRSTRRRVPKANGPVRHCWRAHARPSASRP